MNTDIHAFGANVATRRKALGISQERLAERACVHRTYISQIERGIKVPTLTILLSLAKALGCTPTELLLETASERVDYRINSGFGISCGFEVTGRHVARAVAHTNRRLTELPFGMFRSIDYKTASAILGSLYCDALSTFTDGVVNPIEKGHPDLIPIEGQDASEEELRNYPCGLEIKTTIGNVRQGANLRAGQSRVGELTGITWQAHHRETKELMGLVWDFLQLHHGHAYPTITGVFYSDELASEDWGRISGTTGRNTKVTGMKVSGRKKMGDGWVAVVKLDVYERRLEKFLQFVVRT